MEAKPYSTLFFRTAANFDLSANLCPIVIYLVRCLYRLIRSECVLKGKYILGMKNNLPSDSFTPRNRKTWKKVGIGKVQSDI